MAQSIYGREKASCEFNMTPMIDVTFQLIIFFILAGSFASMDVAKLTVPEVYNPKNIPDLKYKNKAVVNIVPYPEEKIKENPKKYRGLAWRWQLRSETWGPDEKKNKSFDEAALAKTLKGMREKYIEDQKSNPALKNTPYQVELRADGSLHADQIQPVLLAISQAGFKNVQHVVTQTEKVK